MISIQFLHIFRTFLYSFLTFFYFYDSIVNHNYRAHTSGSDGPEAEVRITKPAIPLRTCLPCRAGASQGAFVDISYMITRTLDTRAVVVHQGFCFLSILLCRGPMRFLVSYTLKRKLTTSPSFMTYSLPSERRKPFSLAAAREPPTSMSLS